MSDVKLSPTRLAALRFVADDHVVVREDVDGKPWFTHNGKTLHTRTYRWLMNRGLALKQLSPGYLPELRLTARGEDLLDVLDNPTSEETR